MTGSPQDREQAVPCRVCGGRTWYRNGRCAQHQPTVENPAPSTPPCTGCGEDVMDTEACPNVQGECLDCCGCEH